jgi:D-alanine-D-alanine ligase
LVLSIYGGERSRNRMALVPAMCEGLSVRFVGPDAFGRLYCQDKELSKRLALQCGVLTPRYHMVRRHVDLEHLAPVRFPVVVKPNHEGSSIGISRRSLAHDAPQMRAVAVELLERFQQPVLVEEFVSGREVSYNMIEVGGGAVGHLVEIRLGADPCYFDDRLFCAEEKAAWAEVEVIPLDDQCVAQDMEALQRLATSLGHFGYCRIDGKLHEGRFHFIELTPDAWLDPRGAFALAFTKAGWSYPEVLAKVLASERAGRPHQSSSG